MKTWILLAVMLVGAAALRAADEPILEQARKRFDFAEAELNKAYKATCAELDKAQVAALKKKELEWIEFREARSGSRLIIGQDVENPKLSAKYWECMADYAKMRTEFLRVYSGKIVTKGITGEYIDCYDGDVELEETAEGLSFTFSVVRGPSAHIGQISGVAQRKGNEARFKQKLEEGMKGPGCELIFTFIDGHVVKVEEVSPDPDAGMGVHYDGIYYKTQKEATNKG